MKMRVGTHRAMYPWIDIKAKFLLTLFSCPLVQEEEIKKIYPPPHLYQGRRGEQTNKKKHTLATIF
jgi:hypothetical protein